MQGSSDRERIPDIYLLALTKYYATLPELSEEQRDVYKRQEIGITEEKKLKLRFYLDDLSREGGNFCSLGTWGGYQPGGYINGENVIVKLSEDGYPPTENTRLSYKFNSCFADVIEPNDDGTDTYTVKVANGRQDVYKRQI